MNLERERELEQDQASQFDIDDAIRWQAYCSLKEVLSDKAFEVNYGNGSFTEFNAVVDSMNSRGA